MSTLIMMYAAMSKYVAMSIHVPVSTSGVMHVDMCAAICVSTFAPANENMISGLPSIQPHQDEPKLNPAV
eukprot:1330997-Amorphochlora_amoeboformis.AAC.3